MVLLKMQVLWDVTPCPSAVVSEDRNAFIVNSSQEECIAPKTERHIPRDLTFGESPVLFIFSSLQAQKLPQRIC